MQRLDDVQQKLMDSGTREFVPEFHPIRDFWLRRLDAIVRIITLGKGRVLPNMPHRAPVKWDGIIR